MAVDDDSLRARAGNRREHRRSFDFAEARVQHETRARRATRGDRVGDLHAFIGAEVHGRDFPRRALIGLVVVGELAAREVLHEQHRLRARGGCVAQVGDARVVVDEVPEEGLRGVDRVVGVVDGPADDGEEEVVVGHAPCGRGTQNDAPGGVRGGDRFFVGDLDHGPGHPCGARALCVGHRCCDRDCARRAPVVQLQFHRAGFPAVDVEALLGDLGAGHALELAQDPRDVLVLRGAPRGPHAKQSEKRVHFAQPRNARERGGIGGDGARCAEGRWRRGRCALAARGQGERAREQQREQRAHRQAPAHGPLTAQSAAAPDFVCSWNCTSPPVTASGTCTPFAYALAAHTATPGAGGWPPRRRA